MAHCFTLTGSCFSRLSFQRGHSAAFVQLRPVQAVSHLIRATLRVTLYITCTSFYSLGLSKVSIIYLMEKRFWKNLRAEASRMVWRSPRKWDQLPVDVQVLKFWPLQESSRKVLVELDGDSIGEYSVTELERVRLIASPCRSSLSVDSQRDLKSLYWMSPIEDEIENKRQHLRRFEAKS